MDIAIVQRAVLGGALIGASFSLRLAYEGRSEGISGMTAGLWQGTWRERVERGAFLCAMALAGLAFWLFDPDAFVNTTGRPRWIFALAGFCVGTGARMANGCTSGHGVLGIARHSLRSLVALLLYMAAASAVVTLYPPGGAL